MDLQRKDVMSALALAKVVLALGVATGGGIAAGGQVGQEMSQSASTVSYQTYTVQPGDTLSGISLRFCGTYWDYPELARASGISTPSLIYAGERVVLACHGAASASSSGQSGQPAIQTSGSVAAAGQANIPGTIPDVYSFFGLEQLWRSAGGSSAEQAVAACIAEHESGGRVYATGAQGERGLWQIAPSHGSLSTYDPYGNAKAAVIISNGGADWSQWTTAGSCGV